MKFITFSRSLIILDLLQYSFFRDELIKPEFIQFLHERIESEIFENIPQEKVVEEIQNEINTDKNKNIDNNSNIKINNDTNSDDEDDDIFS